MDIAANSCQKCLKFCSDCFFGKYQLAPEQKIKIIFFHGEQMHRLRPRKMSSIKWSCCGLSGNSISSSILRWLASSIGGLPSKSPTASFMSNPQYGLHYIYLA